MRRGCVVAMVLALGCGGPKGTNDGGAGGGSISEPPPSYGIDETITFVDTDGGVRADSACDLDTYSWSLLSVLSDGGFSSTASSAVVCRHVDFATPPEFGVHYFRQGGRTVPVYFVTRSQNVDLSFASPARKNQNVASAGTGFSFTATNLVAWKNTTDALVVTSAPFANQWSILTPSPSNNAQSFSYHVPWSGPDDTGADLLLVQGSLGDSMYAAQVRSGLDGGSGTRWTSTIASAALQSFDMIDGQDAGVGSVAFSSASTHLGFAWNRKALFDSLDGGSFTDDALTVYPAIGGPQFYYYAPPLAGTTLQAAPVDLATAVDIADPYPVDSVAVATTHARALLSLADGGSADVTLSATVTTIASATTTLSPLISSVQNIRLNGAPASAAQSGVGTLPLLEWTAPSVGAANVYVLTVLELRPAGATVERAKLYTSDSALRIPPGILKPGVAYAVRLDSVSSPGLSAERPFVDGFPFGLASALTAPFYP